MDERLDIVVTGFATTEARAARDLSQTFGVDARVATRFVAELPQVAKRGLRPLEAERYVDALTRIGATVELRPHQPPSHSAPPSALSNSPPKVTESLRPEWLMREALEQLHESERPPSLEPNPSGRLRIDEALLNERALHERITTDTEHRAAQSVRSIGLAHAATALIRPGMSTVSFRGHSTNPPPAPEPPAATRSVKRWPIGLGIALALVLVVFATLAVRQQLQARTVSDALVASMAADGVTAGDHTPALAWLAEADRAVEGIDGARLAEQLERLQRAGSRSLWAIGIGEQAGRKTARAIAVELPEDDSARRTLLFQLGRMQGRAGAIEDRGQRWEQLGPP